MCYISHQAFSVAEEYLGIPPKIAARDLVRARSPDTLTIMAYLSLYYEALHQETPGIIHKNISQGFGDFQVLHQILKLFSCIFRVICFIVGY